jgi:hypothetical protein
MKSLKPATNDVVTCPLCQGHGKLERTKIVTRLNEEEFNRTLQNYIDDVTYGAMELRDPLAVERDVVAVVRGSERESKPAPKKNGA